MFIRPAIWDDLPRIMDIYAAARDFMRRADNPNQWGNNNPPRSSVEEDIQHGVCRVAEEDGRIYAVFAQIPGPDPTYAKIDRAWLNERPYAVMHRVATDGSRHGVMQEILAYAGLFYNELRIDTHKDNIVMQRAVLRGGFKYCGIIYLANGDPRLAYQRSRETPRCLSIGSLNMDHVYRVPAFLTPGETLRSDSLTHVCGGKGLNQSIAAASAGLKVTMAGNVGDNAEGERLCAALTARGVDPSLVRHLPDTDCGHAIIQVADNGENAILLFGGANEQVDSKQISAVMQTLRPGDFIIMQNEINALSEIMEAAHAHGAKIVFNPSPFNARVTESLIASSDILFVNEVEAAQLVNNEAEGESAGALLHARWPHLLLVETLGSNGAVAWFGNEVCHQPIYPVKSVDTTGAGDTFTGFFLGAWARGMSLSDCLDLAARASAICVSRVGTSSAIPTLSETVHARFSK